MRFATPGLADTAFGFRFDMPPLLAVETRPRSFGDRERNDPVDAAPGPAFNAIAGSAADDLLVGTSDADAVGGDAGDDFLYADRPSKYDAASHDADNPLTNPLFSSVGGNDIVSGGAGGDRMHGDVPKAGSALAADFAFPLGLTTSGADYLDGGEGDDTVLGGTGDDIFYGNDGTDRLYGAAGNDNIFGYAGDDIVQSGEGDDQVSGGDGADEFAFVGGNGSDALDHAQSLGTDTIVDYDPTEGDVFSLSDADFGFGTSGSLTEGSNYFEASPITLSATPQDLSSGVSGPAIVIMGANTGSDGVAVYYIDNAAQMAESNSYQLADVINASDIEAAPFRSVSVMYLK